MKRIIALAIAVFVGIAGFAYAGEGVKTKAKAPVLSPNKVKSADTELDAVTAQLHAAYPQMQFEQIDKSPVEGVYFVKGSGNIIHFLPPNTIVFGDMIKAGVNVTAQARSAYEAVQDSGIADVLAKLPLDAAIKIGSGPRVVVEISDPDCPYCRRGTEWFDQNKEAAAKDVTRYVFLYPLPFHANSPAKSKYILCAADKATAYSEVYAGKHDDLVAGSPLPEGCDDKLVTAALAVHVDAANKLRTRGTPNYFIGNERVAGLDPAGITAKLQALQQGGPKSNKKKGGM